MVSKKSKYRFVFGALTLSIVCFSSLQSCSIKSLRVISKADLKEFKEPQSIDFQKSLGLIVLPVEIEGEKYRFIFDTGAQTTIISKQLSEKLEYKREGSLPVRDSHHATERLNVGVVEKMNIEGLHYTNVGVVVNDFKNNLQFYCLDIDGVIGMNMIRLNNWKIDYDNNKVIVLNSKSKISAPGEVPLDFKVKRGTPFVKLYVNGEREEFLLDIGKNGTALSVSPRVVLNGDNKLIGYSSFGMYGKTKFDTVRYAQVELSDGAHFFKESVIVSQASKSSFVMGTGYLEKYYQSVTLDFKRNVIYLKGRSNEQNQILSYPFSAMLLPNAIIVGSKEADYSTLNIGDTIVAVNGIDYNDNGCELLNEIRDSRIRMQDHLPVKVIRNRTVCELSIPIKSIMEKD